MKKDQNLCPHCRIFKEICICGDIKKLSLKTRLTLLIHVKEMNRITNTGRFALYSLENSQALLKGDMESPYDPNQLSPKGYQSLLLTPHASTVLNESFLKAVQKPIHLIVPDGTWQQARKLSKAEKTLYEIPHVKLPFSNNLSSTLRKAPRGGFLPTLGAIAIALGVIENNEVKDYFENLLKTLTCRLRERLKRKPGIIS